MSITRTELQQELDKLYEAVAAYQKNATDDLLFWEEIAGEVCGNAMIIGLADKKIKEAKVIPATRDFYKHELATTAPELISEIGLFKEKAKNLSQDTIALCDKVTQKLRCLNN